MSETKLYMSEEYAVKCNKILQQGKILDSEPQVRVIDNGIILPIRQRKDCAIYHNLMFEGGVCDSNLNFISGLQRTKKNNHTNLTCTRGYIPDIDIVKKDTTVLFGGIVYNHFGHFLVNGLSRIWYFIKNHDIDCKVVFLNASATWNMQEMFNIIGLSEDKIEFIHQPTQFSSIILPDEVIFDLDSVGYKEYLLFFDAVRKKIIENYPKPEYHKIYLTRTKLKKHDCINEEYYENFYQSLGYKIIAPEQHSFVEQINILAHAEKIACTGGTLSYLPLFAQNGIELDCLLRKQGGLVATQSLVNQLKNIKCNIIEVTKEILPTSHVNGLFFFVPTQYFKKYCKENNYLYNENDELLFQQSLYNYLVQYTLHYTNDNRFKDIQNYDLIDILIAFNKFFLNRNVDKNKISDRRRYNVVEQENKLLWQQHTCLSPTYLSLDLHISNIGWIFNIENSSLVLQKFALEAIKINSSEEIIYKIYQDKYGWQEQSSKEGIYCGQTGKAAKIQTVMFRLKETETQTNYSLAYRVFIDKQGWTPFCHDGELCGNLTVDTNYTPIIIRGIQIALVNTKYCIAN